MIWAIKYQKSRKAKMKPYLKQKTGRERRKKNSENR